MVALSNDHQSARTRQRRRRWVSCMRGKIASRRASLSFGAQTALPHAAGGLSRGVEPATGSGAKSVVEAVRLVLAVEANLKPNTGSGARYWLEHGWVGFSMIPPGTGC